MMISRTALRLFALCAVALGSCTSTPDRNPGMMMADGAANHPITVEPSYQSLKLAWSPAEGLTQADNARFDAFVAAYRDHGNGSIAVSAPASPMAQGAVQYFAGRINAMGISRDKILVAAHDVADGDMRVEVNFVSYVASTEKCGDWSDDLSFTLTNSTPKNFGCSVQQNLAAMVADPRDLLGPRTMGEGDGSRAVTILGKYEQGQITAAEKRKNDLSNEQSGVSSKQN
jgi:pilus assembly protein CpaD